MNKDIAQLYGRQCTVRAPAKLNLRLKVEGRRGDGYHLLSMINVAVALYDELKISLSQRPGITLPRLSGGEGEWPEELKCPDKNLAARAARGFVQQFGLPLGVEIELTKNIPLGAGLGGGSSDAAAVLKAMSAACRDVVCETRKMSAAVFQAQVLEIALRLGADVPFFLGPPFAHVAGIGEEIQELDWRVAAGFTFMLFLPPVSIATSQIYEAYRHRFPALEFSRDEAGRRFAVRCRRVGGYLEGKGLGGELMGLIENDLEPLVCETSHEVRALLGRLRGFKSLKAGLTGSGAAVFCIAPQGNFNAGEIVSRLAEQGRVKVLNLRPHGPD